MRSPRLSVRDLADSNAMGRAIGIVLVVLAHVQFADPFWNSLGPFVSGGKLGVSLFVFYSGFLHQFQSRHKGREFSVRAWLIKRALRIYPVYWMGICATIMIGALFKSQNYGAAGIAANIFGIHMFVGQPILASGYIRPYWFISLLLLCYLLFVALRNVRQKGYLALGATTFSLLMVYFRHGGSTGREEHYLLLLAFPAFFWGIWAADRFLDKGRVPGKPALHFLAAILFFCMSALVLKHRHFIYLSEGKQVYFKMLALICLNFTTMFVSLCVAYLCVWLQKRTTAIGHAIGWVGGISFAVYCIHEPLLILLEKVGNLGHPIIGFGLYFIVLLVVSWKLNALGERLQALFLAPARQNAGSEKIGRLRRRSSTTPCSRQCSYDTRPGTERLLNKINPQGTVKVCLAASAGGHLSQLLKLADSWAGHETAYIATTELVRDELSEFGRVYVVGECNRQHPIRVVKVLLRCIRIVFREKPHVVISTGAAAGCIVCFLGKLLGAKVIWIDSITNVEKLSLSGRMVRYVADLLLVQWPKLVEKYDNVEYVGAII